MTDPLLLSNKNVRNFLLLCDLKSFSAVGATLGITQSAVSKSIAALEETVGFPLVERDRRPIVMTHKAMLLRSQLMDIAEALSDTLERLRGDQKHVPEIHVGMLEALSTTLLPLLTEKLSKQYGRIVLHTGPSNYLSLLLAQQKIDIAISGDNCPEADGLWRKRIFTEPTVVAASNDVARKVAGHSDDVLLSLLRLQVPLLMYTQDNQGSLLHQVFLRRLYSRFPQHICVDRNVAMFSLVNRGLGFVVTRLSITAAFNRLYGNFEWLPCSEPLPQQSIYVLARGHEFVALAQEITKLALDFVQRRLLPDIRNFAPPLAEKVLVAGR